jgi:hypothetical protein
VEFALILPVLALLVMGMVDFGRAFYVYEAITNAAREGARFCSLYPGASSATSPPSGVWKRVVTSGSSPDTAELGGRIVAADVTLEVWVTPAGVVPSGSAQDPLSCGPGSDGKDVTVRVTARFSAITPLISRVWGGGPLSIRSRATMPVSASP